MLVYGNNQALESHFASGLYVTVRNINSNLYISDMVIDISKGRNLLVVSPVS